MEHKPYGPYETYFKRPLDILCALAALIVFGWLYILVAVLVRIMLGSPVIFKQPRPGRDEKIFDLYKFRSMTDERDENGELLPDEQRLTKFGKVLRATSLDELPEAFNILKGDMSVIGPGRCWSNICPGTASVSTGGTKSARGCPATRRFTAETRSAGRTNLKWT